VQFTHIGGGSPQAGTAGENWSDPAHGTLRGRWGAACTLINDLVACNPLPCYALLRHDWRLGPQQVVERVRAAEDTLLRVAIVAEAPVRFVVVKLHTDVDLGEVYTIAVDPGV
jgi:hypothetical protein